MYYTSREFQKAITQSHTAVRYAEVIEGEEVLHTFVVVDGEANANASDAIRRDATLTVLDPTGKLAPRDVNDLLMPFGTEFRLRSGVKYGANEEETVPWGVFRLDSSNMVETSDGLVIDINGFDRAFQVQQPASKSVTIKAGGAYEEAIYKVVSSRLNTARRLMVTGYNTPNLYFKATVDMWAEATAMAKSVGCQLYYDVDGALALTPYVVNQDESLILHYTTEDANVFSIKRTIISDGLPNGVVVIGENSQLKRSVRGEAWDLNPKSPTYRFGSYGEVIRPETNEFVMTDQQATAAAQGILEAELGPYETITIETTPNAAQDIGDIVYAERERIGVAGFYVVSDISYPWSTEEPMTITARKKIVDG